MPTKMPQLECLVSPNGYRISLRVVWKPTERVFSTVSEDQRDRFGEAPAGFFSRTALSVSVTGTRLACIATRSSRTMDR